MAFFISIVKFSVFTFLFLLFFFIFLFPHKVKKQFDCCKCSYINSCLIFWCKFPQLGKFLLASRVTAVLLDFANHKPSPLKL